MASGWWLLGGAALVVPAVLVTQMLVEPAHARERAPVLAEESAAGDPIAAFERRAAPTSDTAAQAHAPDQPDLRLPGPLPPLKGMPAAPEPPAPEPIVAEQLSPSPAYGERVQQLDATLDSACSRLDAWSDQLDHGAKLDFERDILPQMREVGTQLAAMLADPVLTEQERGQLMARMEARAKPSVERFQAAMEAHQPDLPLEEVEETAPKFDEPSPEAPPAEASR